VVDFAVFAFGRGPNFPAVGLFEDEGAGFAVEGRFVDLVLFEIVEILQEEEPGGLFRVVQFGGAAGLFPEDVIDVFKTCSNIQKKLFEYQSLRRQVEERRLLCLRNSQRTRQRRSVIDRVAAYRCI
jgi:hypothetical protein